MRFCDGGVRWFLATLVAVFAALCFTALPSYAADTQMEPAHSKTLKDNGDGTSTLSLSVTGDSTLSTTSSKADVIVVLDRSGSMSWGTGSGYRSRLQVAKSAINSLADTLLANNTASDPDKIRLSLVTFANYATTDITNTASLSSFQNTVRSIRADGGTNWEDALAAANSIQTRDGAKKYVIFVSDGDPTFRNTQGNRQFWQNRADYEGHTSGGHTYYGTGDSDDYSNNYNYALQVAQTIAGGGSELYSVAAFGDVSDMQSFSESATGRTDRYYSADDQDALNNAFSAIVQSITNSFGYKSVKITDGVTDATSSTVLQSGSIASDFTYTITDPDGKATTIALDSDGNIKTINGKTSDVTLTDSTGASYILGIGDPFPAASASDKTITWDLSALGQLLDGYEYKVSFKVWPSQDAYDTVAALLNGTKSWDDVDHAQYTRTENSDGSYSYALKTNTEAKVDYTAVKTIDDSHGGTTTEETSGSAAYDQPDPIKLVSDSMGVSKKWVGDTALADDASVTLELYIDGQPSGKTVTLNADNKWKANVHIAPGLEADGQTLNAGHDYTLSEQSTTDSRFEYSAETAHPMIVDGKLAVSDTDGDSALTATNILKSSLNITKTVKDASHDGSADADTLFTYTIAVSDAAHGEVWFSIGKDGKTQIFDADQIAQRVSGAQAEQDSDGKYTGYFHAASGTQVTVKVKDGENIYFPTLTTGSTYTVTEETPAVGYENTSIVNDGGSATNAVPTATGTIEKNNSAYTVGYTNTFDSVSLSGSDALKVTKNVTGRNATEQFAFALTPDADTQAAIDNGSIKVADGANQASTSTKGYIAKDGFETVSFGKYTFYKEGTYHFTADETTETSAPGWTYDSSTHDITVTVAKGADGSLTASTEGNNPMFTNSYAAAPVAAKIPVTKRLDVSDGLTAPDISGKYTFTLKAATEGAPLPEKTSLANPDADGGTVEFGDITYTKPGTYEYTVAESGSVAGVANDPVPERTVQVVVADDGRGQLTATVNGGSEIGFTNTYTVGEAKARIDVVKSLRSSDGLVPPDISGKYTFTLAAVTEGAPMPEKTSLSNPDAAGGSMAFGDIAYDKPGTYEYTVTESGSVDGVTNDPDATKSVTVVVKDNSDGTMSATVNGGKQLVFENTYKASPATATISAKKVLAVASGDNAPDIAGKYTFELQAIDNAPLPEKTRATNPDSTGGTVEFGDITYTKPGTYRYTVTESGSVAGVANDNQTKKHVTVTVTDNSDGTLSAEVTQGKDLTFTNTYKVASTTASIPVTKKLSVPEGLTGPGSIAGKYTFNLEAVDGAPLPAATSLTNPDRDGGTVEFGKITYTQPGTYKYTVTESGSVDGVTNDEQATKNVAVVVADNGDGTLTATVNGGKNVTFTNAYAAASTKASIPVTKRLSVPEGAAGPGDIAGKYTFTLKAATEGAPMPETTQVTNPDADGGTALFGDIEYTEPGTYRYTVTESGSIDGVTNDAEATKNVAVVVADNGCGGLTAAVNGGKDITFTNAYKASPATATISTKKVLAVASGDNAPDIASKYTFTLKAATEGAPMPETTQVTNPDADGGTAEFGKIEFTKAGTYHYTVTESGSVKGIDNDAHATKDVVVVVTDNHAGALSAEVTQGKDLTFTNTYKVASTTASIPVTKKLSVAEGLTGPGSIAGKYTFTLKAATEGAPLPETTQVTNPDADGGTAEFGDITFAEPGTYRYTVTESGSVAGVTNDAQATKDVTVIVTDNGDGTLTAQVNNGRDLTFTNTYTPESATLDGDATLKATKVLTGAELTEGAFNFKAEVETENGTKTLTATNAKDGSVTFDASGLKYTKPGEYKATISEVIPDNAKGITYDTSTHDVLITVKDNGAGKLVASLDGNNPTFKNVYTAKGAASITFSKKVNGKDATTNMFHFTIMADNGGALPENTTVENNGGSVSFGPIAYDESIFGEDDADGSSSSSSSAADKSSSSSATDDGTAAKESTDTGHAADSTATTSSTTESAATASESASSTESSASTSNENADGVEKAYAAEAKPAVQKDANGNRYIDYSYTITEANEGASGYTYDDAAMHVMIRVTDKGDGNLEAKVIYQDKTSFENTYSATGSATITAKKDVEGTDLRDGQFTFGLYDGKDKVAEASNDASGNVTFTVDYDQTMIGTHVYTLKEISDGQTGYTYDGSAKTVAVEVADNGDGELKCTTETGDELTFTNRYQPIATDITLHATKKYEDKSGKAKKLTAGEFKFQVADESGKVMGTASNKADGSVTFPSIPFTEAGTYTYTISEVPGSDTNHVTYDSATYQVTVTVTDDNGQLKAEATDDNPTFTNTYTPDAPPTPKPDDNTPMKTFVKKVTEMPETGDYTPLLPIALALAGSGAVIAYGMKRRRAEAKVNGASHRR